MDLFSKAKLNNGVSMPYLGLGTWNLRGKTLEKVVKWALNIGYIHFDTATLYKNESELGVALKKANRGEIFVTTKVWPSDFGFNSTLKALDTSLSKLQMDYVDQYLIHWPKSKIETQDTWKALLKLLEEGKCKTIGVSNFSIQQLEELKDIGDVIPATNQIRFSPWDYREDIVKYCDQEGIKIVAYSPLNEGRGLKNEKLINIAKKYNRTPAQICLRWNLEHGAITIPKSADNDRLQENTQIFDFNLDEIDVESVNSL